MDDAVSPLRRGRDIVTFSIEFIVNISARSRRTSIRALVAIGIFAFAVAAVSAVQLSRAGPAFNGTPYPDAPPAPDFALVDHTGSRLTLADLRGEAVLLYFGFTRCPDICPLTLSSLRTALAGSEIGPDQLKVLLVSVDPEYDTPARLAEFIRPFGPNVIGLTGPRSSIDDLLADYGAYAESSVGHDGVSTIAHTGLVFGIDRAGRLRVLIHPDEPVETVRSDIETLLQLS